jgi:thioredoxin-related protein
MKPIVHGLEAKYADRLGFVYLDIDDPNTENLKQALGYRVQPHFFLVDGEGNVLQQWLGSVREDEFVSAFEAALK